ncbi:histidinol-phosphate transaminase [Peribacillus sp. SCS-26]|uniref:histidinol-phosphate transaminase n=1 Tax=Paraperibacillus marinus TaxID=3115295 RepID=UPI0039061C3B
MKIEVRPELKGIKPYELGQTIEDIKRLYGIKTVRKLSDNENVYGTSKSAAAAAAEAARNLSLYPDGAGALLIRRLAEHYGISEKYFLLSNGSEEIIRLLVRACITRGDEAVMASLTFPRYQTNTEIEGGRAVTVPLMDGRHDLAGMLASVTPRTKMIFVCNPNNPTGTIAGREELQSFIQAVPPHILIVMDEAYCEYADSKEYLNTLPLIHTVPNLVILRTFSKIYGLAGLRIGYGIMSEAIAAELHKVRDVFNVNALAQAAAAAALDDQEFIGECAEKNRTERGYLQDKLQCLGILSFPSQTNFLFAFGQEPVIPVLMRNGVLVRRIPFQGYKEAFRITLGTREDHDHIVDVLTKHLGERGVQGWS